MSDAVAAAPSPGHELLLGLAGWVDDDLLAIARELVAVGEEAGALELLVASLSADRTVLPHPLRAGLADAVDRRIGGDLTRLLPPGAPLPDRTAHVFAADAGDLEATARIDEVVAGLTAVARSGARTSVTWRLTPAGAAPGPLPHPVVLLVLDDPAPAEVLTYQVGAALARAGVTASVEAFADGAVLPPYQRAALAAAGTLVRSEETSGRTGPDLSELPTATSATVVGPREPLATDARPVPDDPSWSGPYAAVPTLGTARPAGPGRSGSAGPQADLSDVDELGVPADALVVDDGRSGAEGRRATSIEDGLPSFDDTGRTTSYSDGVSSLDDGDFGTAASEAGGWDPSAGSDRSAPPTTTAGRPPSAEDTVSVPAAEPTPGAGTPDGSPSGRTADAASDADSGATSAEGAAPAAGGPGATPAVDGIGVAPGSGAEEAAPAGGPEPASHDGATTTGSVAPGPATRAGGGGAAPGVTGSRSPSPDGSTGTTPAAGSHSGSDAAGGATGSAAQPGTPPGAGRAEPTAHTAGTGAAPGVAGRESSSTAGNAAPTAGGTAPTPSVESTGPTTGRTGAAPAGANGPAPHPTSPPTTGGPVAPQEPAGVDPARFDPARNAVDRTVHGGSRVPQRPEIGTDPVGGRSETAVNGGTTPPVSAPDTGPPDVRPGPAPEPHAGANGHPSPRPAPRRAPRPAPQEPVNGHASPDADRTAGRERDWDRQWSNGSWSMPAGPPTGDPDVEPATSPTPTTPPLSRVPPSPTRRSSGAGDPEPDGSAADPGPRHRHRLDTPGPVPPVASDGGEPGYEDVLDSRLTPNEQELLRRLQQELAAREGGSAEPPSSPRNGTSHQPGQD